MGHLIGKGHRRVVIPVLVEITGPAELQCVACQVGAGVGCVNLAPWVAARRSDGVAVESIPSSQ